MKACLALLLLLCAPVSKATKSDRWKINLEQSLGLQSFERGPGGIWTKQQGVVFLSPSRLLVYQVNRSAEAAKLAPRSAAGGAGNFRLNIRVLSVQDGHLIKSLDLPTNAGLSRIMPVTGGGFLARTGTTLNLYSPDFRLLASRELPIEKVAPLEGWQVRVSPAGDEVVLIHDQVFATAEILGDGTVLHDGKAHVEVEVLSAETLQSQKSVTLAHTLAFWAPAGDHLISSNPAHSYSDGELGILDFNGSWSPLRADFQLPKSPCPYSVDVIEPQLVVVFGCESLTVLSAEGKRVLSINDSRFVFRSVASGGPYLAVGCDRYRTQDGAVGALALPTRADRVELYDMETRRRLASASIHADSLYYAVSAQGELAIVDGKNLELLSTVP